MTTGHSKLQAEYPGWWGHNLPKPFNWQVFLIWKPQQMALDEPGVFKSSRVKATACELAEQTLTRTSFPDDGGKRGQ